MESTHVRELRTDGELNLLDQPHVVAWKVAREVCASLKQSQLMRLFVPEKTCLWWNG